MSKYLTLFLASSQDGTLIKALQEIADLTAAHSRLSASTALNSLLTPASCHLKRSQGATKLYKINYQDIKYSITI